MKGEGPEKLKEALEKGELQHRRIEVYSGVDKVYMMGYDKKDEPCLFEPIPGKPGKSKEYKLEKILKGKKWETFS